MLRHSMRQRHLLKDLASRFEHAKQKTTGTKSASNGFLHLRMVFQPAMGQPWFTMRPEVLSDHPDAAHDDCEVAEAGSSAHEVVIQLLLDKSADVDARNRKCPSPLYRAVGFGRGSIVQLLLDEALLLGKSKSGFVIINMNRRP